jgi:hypothetical protein
MSAGIMKSRRDVIWMVPILASVTAGCSFESVTAPDPNRPDLYVCNETDVHVEYNIELERTTAENQILLDERGELGIESETGSDSECRYYSNIITEPGSYTLRLNPSLPYEVVVFFDEPAEPTNREDDSDGVGITLFEDTYTTELYSAKV